MTMSSSKTLGSFSGSDSFLLDHQLSEEERLLRDAAAGFAIEELGIRVEAAYLEENTDPAIFAEMGAGKDNRNVAQARPRKTS
jgi:glutaryl-CoA dehydrogenase